MSEVPEPMGRGRALAVLLIGSLASSHSSGGGALADGWTMRSIVLPVAPGWLGAVLVADHGDLDSPWLPLAAGLAVTAVLVLWTAAALRRRRPDAVALGMACGALQAFFASAFVG